MPEDAPAPLAAEEAPVVPDHSRRNLPRHDIGRHDPMLPVALHAARQTPLEVEATCHHTKLVLHGEVRHHEERHPLVPYRLAFEETPIAGQEHAPLVECYT